MPSKPRPGTPLTDNERLAGLLGDAVDQLESMQAVDPSQAREAVADTVRYVRDTLARRQAPDREEGEIPF
jgi:hypothetical protein